MFGRDGNGVLMETVDDAVMSDAHDVINSVSFEKLVRRA